MLGNKQTNIQTNKNKQHNKKGQTKAAQQSCGIHSLRDIENFILQTSEEPGLSYSCFEWWIVQNNI